jgi:Tfp pilus assembly protein PilO
MKFPVIKNPFKKVKKDEFSKYLELMPDFKQEKTQKFTTIALTLIASIILGLFAINPTLSTIANLQKQLDDNKFVEQKLEHKINDLSILQQKYALIQPDLGTIKNAIPQAPETTTLLGQIQAVAKDSSLSVIGLQTFEVDIPPIIIGEKKYSAFNFSVFVQGGYKNMISFINELTSIQRIIVLNNATITRNTDNNKVGDLRLTIKGTVYYKN